MIISCDQCNKKFEIDSNLIPKDGRLLECGSCNHKWFYKQDIEDKTEEIIIEPQLKNIEEEDIDPIRKDISQIKELAIAYANKNKIEFEIIVPKERKIIKKSYADNFTK